MDLTEKIVDQVYYMLSSFSGVKPDVSTAIEIEDKVKII